MTLEWLGCLPLVHPLSAVLDPACLQFLMRMKYKGACLPSPNPGPGPSGHLAVGVGWILILMWGNREKSLKMCSIDRLWSLHARQSMGMHVCVHAKSTKTAWVCMHCTYVPIYSIKEWLHCVSKLEGPNCTQWSKNRSTGPLQAITWSNMYSICAHCIENIGHFSCTQPTELI